MNSRSEDGKDCDDCILRGENFLRAGQLILIMIMITYVSSFQLVPEFHTSFSNSAPESSFKFVSIWLLFLDSLHIVAIIWVDGSTQVHRMSLMECPVNVNPVGVVSVNSSGPMNTKFAECCHRNFMSERIWSGLSSMHTTSSSTSSFPLELVNMIEPCL